MTCLNRTSRCMSESMTTSSSSSTISSLSYAL
jgi:hypothetical protein